VTPGTFWERFVIETAESEPRRYTVFLSGTLVPPLEAFPRSVVICDQKPFKDSELQLLSHTGPFKIASASIEPRVADLTVSFSPDEKDRHIVTLVGNGSVGTGYSQASLTLSLSHELQPELQIPIYIIPTQIER
jgi:hypothetical protein